MPDELYAALEQAISLNAQAIRVNEEQPPSDGRAVLASALRENRDALVRAVAATLAALTEEAEALAAARAAARTLSAAPAVPSGLRLVANG